jgi:hypothetical protein
MEFIFYGIYGTHGNSRPFVAFGWLMHLLYGGFLYTLPSSVLHVQFSFSCCQYLILDVIPLFNVDYHRLHSCRVAERLFP